MRLTTTDIDAIVVPETHLEALVELLGGPETIRESPVTILSEDDHTRGRPELNLVSFEADLFADPDREYGTATQIHDSVGTTDTALDLRR